MTTDPWTAEILADIAAAYAHRDDIAELARGAAAVLALHTPDPRDPAWCRECTQPAPCSTVRAFNNPNGDTP